MLCDFLLEDSAFVHKSPYFEFTGLPHLWLQAELPLSGACFSIAQQNHMEREARGIYRAYRLNVMNLNQQERFCFLILFSLNTVKLNHFSIVVSCYIRFVQEIRYCS